MAMPSLGLVDSESLRERSDGRPSGQQRSTTQLALFTLIDSAIPVSDSTEISKSPATFPRSTSSPEDSPVRISASRGKRLGWPEADPVFSSNLLAFWKRLVRRGSSSKTSLVCFPHMAAEIWQQYSVRWLTAGTASRGGYSTLSFSDSPNDARGCFLLDILQETRVVPPRFYLSRKACAGILRRAQKRAKKLPERLAASLAAASEQLISIRTEPSSSSTDARRLPSLSPYQRWRASAGLPKDAPSGSSTASSMRVRRLTPTECERLQGFPDHWTCVRNVKTGLMAFAIEASAMPSQCPSCDGSSTGSRPTEECSD